MRQIAPKALQTAPAPPIDRLLTIYADPTRIHPSLPVVHRATHWKQKLLLTNSVQKTNIRTVVLEYAFMRRIAHDGRANAGV